MINFYKENGIGKIAFADGGTVSLSDDVTIHADSTTNQIVISEFNEVKFWIGANETLLLNGSPLSGTIQQKADAIAAIFQSVGNAITSYNSLTDLPQIPTGLEQIADSSNRFAVSAAEKAFIQNLMATYPQP